MLSVYGKEFSLYIIFVVAPFTWRVNHVRDCKFNLGMAEGATYQTEKQI